MTAAHLTAMTGALTGSHITDSLNAISFHYIVTLDGQPFGTVVFESEKRAKHYMLLLTDELDGGDFAVQAVLA